MATKTSTSKVVKKTKICLICNSELKETDLYKSRNDVIDDSFSICKNCACREANQNIDKVHEILMLLDIPFIPELYKEVEGESNVFSAYMLRINNPKKKHDDGRKLSELKYKDSPTLEQIKDVDTYIYASNDKMSELIALFGDKWKKETLLAMNKELDDMIVQYGGSREELPTMDLYCELIRLKWLAREQMDSGNVTQGKQLLAERNKMLKENGMTVQAMKEKKSSDSFGVDIDYAEYRPIRPKKKYSDYSGLMHMFKYFITHQERFYGDNQKPIDDDYEEMDKYKKSHPKEYKAEMFPDDYDFTKEDEEIEEE